MAKTIAVEERIFTHEYLWRSSTTLFIQSELQSEKSQDYLIPSLLMSFLAFEAFINFCGETLAPEIWEKEKENFKTNGLDNKLSAIFKNIPQFNWEKGKYPYQKIKDIENFRHMAVHGKVFKSEYQKIQNEDALIFNFVHAWDRFLSTHQVKAYRKSIEDFCNSILDEARKISDDPHFIPRAFNGSVASATSTEIF